MMIDTILPDYDVTHVSETVVDATPVETYRAIMDADLRDPLIGMLFAVRELPERVRRRWYCAPPAPKEAVTFRGIANEGPGWTWLVEDPGFEFVVGSVGRFWKRDYGGRAVTAEEFLRFNEPGYARLAISFSVRPKDFDRTVLRYEARTVATDEESRRKLRMYWRVIEPGVAIVMDRALKRIRAHAEQALVGAGA
jgi:hypothetical protein